MAAKRILLMYISEVSGHRSAAMAIEKALKSDSPETEILSINAFHYTNPVTEKIINRLYMSMIQNTPKIWDYLYDNPAVERNIQKLKDFVNKINASKLKKLFSKFQPDIVACTQAFPCGMVAELKKRSNTGVKLVAVLTDFVPHSYWIYNSIDYYVSPSDEVTLRLLRKGVDSFKIKTIGIPFDQKFNKPVDKEEVRLRLNLAQNSPTILIMGGGHGLGPIKTIVESLEKAESGIQEIIVAGINTKLFNSLKKVVGKCKKKITLLGFVDNINELMSVSDIIITKPGGITTAEALTKKLPMIIVKPIPGQEANNTEYLMGKGAAIKTDNPEEINLIVDSLLRDPEKLNRMREYASRISKPDSSTDIARLLLSI